ncbi:MAG: serine/threonine-protein kinase [Planctomycetota bacterium]|nr:serine/threonine-protein kinase [Planctomycetota bacterium]
MLVPSDIIAAKLIGQMSSIPIKEIRKTLIEADEAPDSSMDLIARLTEKSFLSSAEGSKLRRYVAHFEHVRYEAMYLKRLSKVINVPKNSMFELMAHLESNSYRRRVGPILVELGWVNIEQAQQIESQTRRRLLKEDLKVLERYRGEKFKGVAKPLINQEKVDDRVFRVSVLFHSQETVDQVNKTIEKMRAAGSPNAQQLTPYSVDPAAAKLAQKKNRRNSRPNFNVPASLGMNAPIAPATPAYTPAPTPSPSPTPVPQSSEITANGKPPSSVHEAYAQQDTDIHDDDPIITEEEAKMHNNMRTARYKALSAPSAESNLEELEEIGPYDVMECLGQGGMGAVYMCRESNNGTMAAVKVMLADRAKASDIKRFRREARITELLDHKNTIGLIDQGKTNEGLDWMAISLCAGKSLKGIIKKDGRMLVDVAFHIFEQILEGLESVHQKSIVHRDLKPDNIFVQAGNHKVTIMDFGIARIIDTHLPKEQREFQTKNGVVSGSPSYIAPETISGDDIDARTDIYSLGIMLYEMLTGKLPLYAETPYDYLREHLIGVPMTLYQGCKENYWCSDLEQMIATMLAKEKEDRPASCQIILDALRGGIRDQAIEQLKNPPKGGRPSKSLFNNFFKLLGR